MVLRLLTIGFDPDHWKETLAAINALVPWCQGVRVGSFRSMVSAALLSAGCG